MSTWQSLGRSRGWSCFTLQENGLVAPNACFKVVKPSFVVLFVVLTLKLVFTFTLGRVVQKVMKREKKILQEEQVLGRVVQKVMKREKKILQEEQVLGRVVQKAISLIQD